MLHAASGFSAARHAWPRQYRSLQFGGLTSTQRTRTARDCRVRSACVFFGHACAIALRSNERERESEAILLIFPWKTGGPQRLHHLRSL